MRLTGLNDFRFGKLREPANRFVQFARTFGINSSPSKQWINRDLSETTPALVRRPRAPVGV